MKKLIKVVYKEPYMKNADQEIDAIIIYYPYAVEGLVDIVQNPSPETENYVVKVSVSGSLAITWGYRTWLQESEYAEMKRILFQYAKTSVVEKIKRNVLKNVIEVILSTKTHPEYLIYNPADLPEVDGFVEEILI